jgi:hypothetical protein
MATGKAKMKVLEDQRDALLNEIEALRNKVAGLEMAMALLSGDSTTDEKGKKNSGKINVTATLLDLLKQAGTTGLNAQTAVEIAQARGIELEKSSVSSLLSRLKREGTLVYDGERYRLKEFANVGLRPMPGTVSSLVSSAAPRAYAGPVVAMRKDEPNSGGE